MMDDGSEGNEPKANKKDGKLLVTLSAVIVVAVMTIALILASGVLTPRGEDGLQNSDDTSSDVSENKEVSGEASDFLLNESDMGAEWVASDLVVGPVDEYLPNESATSIAGITFKRYNSTGQLEYVVEIRAAVFDTINNVSAYYNKSIEVHPEDDSYLPPEYRPSYTVVIANVSMGDEGVILDLPRITLGHEAKALIFIDRNVICGITYHHATSIDPLPNELLIDLADKMKAKIA